MACLLTFLKMFFLRLKNILHKAFLHAFKVGRLHLTARFGILSLIPKGKRSRTILKNWRPISLLCTEYKLLAKILANRINTVIHDLIDPDQCGFIKGRNISMNIRTMFDIMHYTWLKKLPALAILVDFEKAFDRVDYESLYCILQFFGFGPTFVKWVKLIFTDFNLPIINNGNFSSQWTPTQGLYQGNPVTPVLFLLLAETLAMKLRDNPRIEPIEINGFKYLLSQFANDLSIFTKFKQDSWQEIMNVFDIFEIQTGMKISYEKTTIYRIGSIRNTDVKFFSSRRVNWISDPVKLLGVTISHDKQECYDINLKPLLARTKNILDIWKIRNLSLIGKVEVANTLVSSLFVYKCTVLPTLKQDFILTYNQLIRDFIWEGKKVKIALSTLMVPKQEGGLALVDLAARDKALKGQWVMQIGKNEKLANLAYTMIGNEIVHQLWECQLKTKDLRVLFSRVPVFWKDVMAAWFNLNEITPSTREQVCDQIVWYNSDIRIKDTPIFHKKLYVNGLVRIRDLLEEDFNLLDFRNFREKFHADLFLVYAGIRSAIPKSWKTMLKFPSNA